MSSVNVRNCIRFYQTAEELNASTLMNYCGEIIASHWVSIFSSHHFVTSCDLLWLFFLSDLHCLTSDFRVYATVNLQRPRFFKVTF